MNKKVKKLWVAALKSGDYKQTTNALRKGNQNGTRYCCLGVLADLAVKAGACTDRQAFHNASGSLTESVMGWAGLTSESPTTPDGNLIDLNDDGGASFKDIATVINKHL